jgi:hypothetical protein
MEGYKLLNDPYTVQLKRRLTWLLCCKHLNHIRQCLNRDMCTEIAKLIKLDFSGKFKSVNGKETYRLSFTLRDYLTWRTNESWFAIPCEICLLPCYTKKLEHKCPIHGFVNKNNFVGYLITISDGVKKTHFHRLSSSSTL